MANSNFYKASSELISNCSDIKQSKTTMKHSKITLGWQAPILFLLIAAILISGCTSQTQKVYHVGILYIPGAFDPVIDGFKAKMTELGYVEGENIIYENMEESVTATTAEAQALAKKLVDAKVDLIFAFPTPPTIAAHAAAQGTDIPVVFGIANPEILGLVKSVREPGGNMTGVRFPGPEMISKRLDILLEISPNIKRVWIGYDKNHPNTAPTLDVLRPAASQLNVTLVEVSASTLEEFKADLASRAASADLGIDAIVTMSDGFNSGTEGSVMLNKFAADHKIPLAGGSLVAVERGAVIGNSASLSNTGELAAFLADKIFKGIPAGTIPIITPEQEMYVNYKVAQELGLNLSDGLLAQANKIIR
jgi:putative tryptophan/tyrosine transport system substrate-binding protein